MQLSNVLSGKIVMKEPREYLVGRQARLLLTAVPLFALFVALFAVVQFATPGLAGNDGYYHIKMTWFDTFGRVATYNQNELLAPQIYADDSDNNGKCYGYIIELRIYFERIR